MVHKLYLLKLEEELRDKLKITSIKNKQTINEVIVNFIEEGYKNG